MIRAVVTDIEGTTTAVSFVYDVLFPYARAHLGAFVRAHGHEPAVRAELAAVAREERRAVGDEEALAVLERWMDEDRKATPLKALQGMVWEVGFRSGAFTGHVYPDAVEHLRRWHGEGIALYVYSSGSVEAQRLLFGYSDFGDLTPLFRDHFDTRVGAKRAPESYRRLAAAIGLPAAAVLFLSDVEAELDAARAAGMRTAWLVREGALDPHASHPQARTFADIDLGAL